MSIHKLSETSSEVWGIVKSMESMGNSIGGHLAEAQEILHVDSPKLDQIISLLSASGENPALLAACEQYKSSSQAMITAMDAFEKADLVIYETL